MESQDLIARVSRGDINFVRLVELLSTRGYITEERQENGCGFGSSGMEAVRQYDFDALFSLLLPSRQNDISLACEATDEDGPRGAFAYALYNKNVISREGILEILKGENRETVKWLNRSGTVINR